MNLPPPTAADGPLVRRARPDDAQDISALYVRTYTPEDGGSASESYPFPQVLDPDGVAELIAGGTVIWVVAEVPGRGVVGTTAAVRNIGDGEDRIAEVFGVAVDDSERHRGIGSALLGRLVEDLGDSSEFLLCEARTAEAGGWKVARKAGFLPVGFEPYAHAMPIGFESMVLTGRAGWMSGRWPVPDAGVASNAAVVQLAEAVRGRVNHPDAPLSDRQPRSPSLKEYESVAHTSASLKIRRDDQAGQTWFEAPGDIFDRRSGVVGLRPFEGIDRRGSRFERPYYVASSGTHDLGSARIFYDRIDARARILGLQTRAEGARGALLAGVVENLVELTQGGPLVVLICVRADASEVQAELDSAGFLPTAYLPGLIATRTGRGDVVQYTRLIGRSLRDSVRRVTALEWPEARTVIQQVLGFDVGLKAPRE